MAVSLDGCVLARMLLLFASICLCAAVEVAATCWLQDVARVASAVLMCLLQAASNTGRECVRAVLCVTRLCQSQSRLG